MSALPLVPFAYLPRKEWDGKMEKKTRIEYSLGSTDHYFEEEDDESEEYESDSSSGSEFSQLQRHIASLMPGEVIDGRKPEKQADTRHLQDLRVVKQKKNRLKFFRHGIDAVKELRANERERRKHHIIREYEAKIQRTQEQQLERQQLEREQKEKNERLEEYRSMQRRIRNSKQKKKQEEVVAHFTQGLDRLEAETKLMDFRANTLSRWAVEGLHDKETRRREEERVRAAQEAEEEKEHRKKQLTLVMSDDSAVLAQDRAMTQEVMTMMKRYGMMQYRAPVQETTDQKVNRILNSRASYSHLQPSQLQQEEASAESSDDSNDDTVGVGKKKKKKKGATEMILTLKKGLDMLQLKNEFIRLGRKGKKKELALLPPLCPFEQSFNDTSQVRQLKGTGIQETGCLSLSVEINKGAFPMLEHLDLSHCRITTNGIKQLLAAFRNNNLLTLTTFKLQGNFLTHSAAAHFREACGYGLFTQLEYLDCSQNDLKDEGVGTLVSVVLSGQLSAIREVHVQSNGVTDKGFSKAVKVLQSTHEKSCPALVRFGLERNLVSAGVKRLLAPLPFFVSV